MARRRTFPTLAALAVLLTAGVAASAPQTFAQAGIRASGSPEAHSAVAYTIALAHLEQHLVEVRIALPPGAAQRELQLPVWNALYQVRDFAQYVNWVRAFDATGRQIPVHKLNKSLWRISGADGGGSVEYEIFVDSPGPFGAQLNSRHAFLNLAQLLMYAVDERAAPVTVRFNRVPGDWRIATPLEPMPDGQFGAENYDRLVDSPVEIGRFQESDFEEGGAHYRVIVDARSEEHTSELQS